MRGRLITLEGGEGTGKSTQAERLADRLRQRGVSVVVTREPGGSPVAERIRDLIFVERPRSAEAEFLLFAAARAEHLATTILPALDAGRWVVCDRFIDSTRVYQGALRKVDAGFIAAVETYTLARGRPDLTLVLDLPVAVGLARTRQRGDLNRYDEAAIEHHEIIRREFLDIARRDPSRCSVIDATPGPETVAASIWAVIEERFAAQLA